MSVVKVATCNLNQWSLDFKGNVSRIRESIRIAKRKGCTYRLGPELEIPGYGCEDHFLEHDTFVHSWDALYELLPETDGILCDFGMPVLHKGVRYNCRVFCYNGEVLLIRPKLHLADDGNYREGRYFTAWNWEAKLRMMGGTGVPLEETPLPDTPAKRKLSIEQKSTQFGVGIIECLDGSVSSETCEELFTARSPHIALSLDGVDIIGNGSGSHHQLRKLNTRVDLICEATAKCGGVYLYANQQGCDGGRLYYDGCALVSADGVVVQQGTQFSVRDVEVVHAAVDLEASRSFRSAIASRGQQTATQPPVPRVKCDLRLSCHKPGEPVPNVSDPVRPRIIANVEREPGMEMSGRRIKSLPGMTVAGRRLLLQRTIEESRGPSSGSGAATGGAAAAAAGASAGDEHLPAVASVKVSDWNTDEDEEEDAGYSASSDKAFYHSPEEEIAFGPACWMWDYLRRSGAGGFLLPLSGGADSSSTCALVGSMCCLVHDEAMRERKNGTENNEHSVTSEIRRVARIHEDDPIPGSAQALANLLMHTVYLGTVNSSTATRTRASQLAEQVGTWHLEVDIDTMVASVVETFTGGVRDAKRPQFSVKGGTAQEDIALQNVQARLRMVFSYVLAQLLPEHRQRIEKKLLEEAEGAGASTGDRDLGSEEPPAVKDASGVAVDAIQRAAATNARHLCRRAGDKPGFLLVLGSANVDEGLRGYMTKYDCSSADINPIGSVSKLDLKRFLFWAGHHLCYSSLLDVVNAVPTAELRPNFEGGDDTVMEESGSGAWGAAAKPDGDKTPPPSDRSMKKARELLAKSTRLSLQAASTMISPDEAAELAKEAAECSRKASEILSGGHHHMRGGGSSGDMVRSRGASEASGVSSASGTGAAVKDHSQSDEDDMGMTYKELGRFGRLRKMQRCGPLAMYTRLVHEWQGTPPEEVAKKVKRFFFYYAINRHKMTVLTPSYHAESYSPDDNRFDLRPFLYPIKFDAQYQAIDADVQLRQQAKATGSEGQGQGGAEDSGSSAGGGASGTGSLRIFTGPDGSSVGVALGRQESTSPAETARAAAPGM